MRIFLTKTEIRNGIHVLMQKRQHIGILKNTINKSYLGITVLESDIVVDNKNKIVYL